MLKAAELNYAFTDYSYLYPPRPEKKIPVGMLGYYQNRGYYAQVKKNGTNTVIFCKGDKVIFKTRHADDHRAWTPLAAHFAHFRGFDKWHVFCAELLHSKTPHIKNQFYIYDIIVADDVQLVSSTFAERQELLSKIWTPLHDEGDQIRVGNYVSIAKNLTTDFRQVFDRLKPEDEGLVLKDPNGKLKPGWKANANEAWQVKCRIPHKNYSF